MGHEISTLGGAIATAATSVAAGVTFGQVDCLNDAVKECALFTADEAAQTNIRHVGELVGVSVAAGVTFGQIESLNDHVVRSAEATGSTLLTTLNDTADGLPIIGHVKGGIHHACGDHEGGNRALMSASRTAGVFIGGALGIAGGPAGMIAGGVAGGQVMDGMITGVDSAINGEFRPFGQIAAWDAVANAENPQDRIAGVVGGFMTPVMDGVAGRAAGEVRANLRALRMQRMVAVEVEGAAAAEGTAGVGARGGGVNIQRMANLENMVRRPGTQAEQTAALRFWNREAVRAGIPERVLADFGEIRTPSNPPRGGAVPPPRGGVVNTIPDPVLSTHAPAPQPLAPLPRAQLVPSAISAEINTLFDSNAGGLTVRLWQLERLAASPDVFYMCEFSEACTRVGGGVGSDVFRGSSLIMDVGEGDSSSLVAQFGLRSDASELRIGMLYPRHIPGIFASDLIEFGAERLLRSIEQAQNLAPHSRSFANIHTVRFLCVVEETITRNPLLNSILHTGTAPVSVLPQSSMMFQTLARTPLVRAATRFMCDRFFCELVDILIGGGEVVVRFG